MSTSQYCYVLKEIFCDYIYFINPIYLTKDRYSVIDFGMNRGYASLYFAEQDWCHNVISVEMVPNTFRFAQKKLPNEPEFGLKDHRIQLRTCWQRRSSGDLFSTTPRWYFLNVTGLSLQIRARRSRKEILQHRSLYDKKASNFAQSITPHLQDNIILKIDVEGAEYAILNDLIDNNPEFFNNIDIITGELHLGMQNIDERMLSLGYELVETKQNGQVCDVLFIKHAAEQSI